MNMNLNYSSLFSSMGNQSSNSSGLYSMLGEYNNIRTGSYHKVLKQYFKTDKTTDTASSKKEAISALTTQSSDKKLTAVKQEANGLSSAAKKLMDTSKDSLFTEKETTVENKETGEKVTSKALDTDAIYKAVKKFVSAYNDTVDAAETSKNSSVLNNVQYMMKQTDTFSRALKEVGITIDEDKQLVVDEDKFKSSNMNNVKALFNGNASYAYSVSQRADQIAKTATQEATAANMFYSNAGGYQAYGSASNAFDWYL